MDMREWYVKWGAIIIAAYIVLFGFPRLAKCDLAFEIGNNPVKIVENVNANIPATSRNCKQISKYVYSIMSRCHYSELKVIGVWTANNGHMFIAFKDSWGKQYIITTLRGKKKWSTELLPVKSIESFCSMWSKNWTHYFEYRRDGKVFTKRMR